MAGEMHEGQGQPELIIQEGLKAYQLPDLASNRRGVYGYNELHPPTGEQAKEGLDKILASIEAQGGTLIGVVPMSVFDESDEAVGPATSKVKPATFLIVKK